ncbi:hypothetical protein F3Y22_tig00110429pilonHSYRG00541 [Hibiscus syriacus]|uniref:DUF4283 domain-containing protein n=1 Tax=Hibiscus syriacus TaxID=106335 RepID=A0A6A3APL4_HIBSY|nr:hypothetical protein F3Y22_tig00110429pilonHSYRG00541 [Hibiscus syriacus]
MDTADSETTTGNHSYPAQSYAFILTGTSSGGQSHRTEQEDCNNDFDISEKDIIKGTRYRLPSIQFTERAYKLMEVSMTRTVVLKLLGRNIGLNALTNKTYALWQPSQPFTLMELENGYFLARFKNDEDFFKVLADGPWMIYDQYLTVQVWSMEFCTSQPYPTTVVGWMRFPVLPEYMYNKKILVCIGSLVGRVAKPNFQKATSHRRCFARVAIYVDLTKPLIPKVVIGEKIQIVE